MWLVGYVYMKLRMWLNGYFMSSAVIVVHLHLRHHS